jgi:cystathionine beta-lyase/cystathionine gamma-synthase
LALDIANKHRETHHIIQVCKPTAQKIPGAEIVDMQLSATDLFSLLLYSDKPMSQKKQQREPTTKQV